LKGDDEDDFEKGTREEKDVMTMTLEMEDTLEWRKRALTLMPTTMVRAREKGNKEVTTMTILERERKWTLKRARRAMTMSCPRPCLSTKKSGS
jgi:hypothetical protein